jgi:hypothetical protein
MVVYKNKHSGRYFIYIMSGDDDKVALVTPLSDVKYLHLGLFDGPEEGDEKDYLARGLITARQAQIYHQELRRLDLETEVDRKEESRRKLEET